jgi:hypothetical protein
MDTSIVSTAIFTIANEFGDYSGAVWVTLAYTLSYIGMSPSLDQIRSLLTISNRNGRLLHQAF